MITAATYRQWRVWNDILTSESFYWRWDASGDKWVQRVESITEASDTVQR
jgi:hypothetical protein